MQRTAQKKKKLDGSPRYPKSKNQIYHDTYDKLMKNSVIFNDAKRSKDLSNATIMFGISESKGALIELIGNEKGYYRKEGNWYEALIPIAKKAMIPVLNEFKRWQDQQVRSGLSLTRPKKWPTDLEEKRLKAEAVLDIRIAEKKALENHIKELEKAKESERKQLVLPNGPQGRMAQANSNSPITAADGQQVSYTLDGIPFISEKDSPYFGMSIFEYRKMCKIWKREMGLMPEQLRKKAEEIFLEQTQQAKQEAKEPPTRRLSTSEVRIPEWMERLGITKSEWPNWPEGVEQVKSNP
ncbi:MAG: hypothetical protein JXR20_05750 [Balneola sp.]